MPLEVDAAAFEALTPDERAEFLRLVAIAYPSSRWYCDRPQCDGEPHPGWHWCEHELPHPPGGEEYSPCRHARTAQRPPPVEWRYWLFMGGRGTGKTRAGAEWMAHEATAAPDTHWAVVARTGKDLRDACFEGKSGLLKALGISRHDETYNISAATVRLPNGAVIHGISAEEPGSMRGPDLDGAWLDELTVWKHRSAYEDLLPAVRHGQARLVITTTPRPHPILTGLLQRERGVVVTRGSMFDNAPNLSPDMQDDLRFQWEGTRMARQELYGELLEDVPGALFSKEALDAARGVLVE